MGPILHNLLKIIAFTVSLALPAVAEDTPTILISDGSISMCGPIE